MKLPTDKPSRSRLIAWLYAFLFALMLTLDVFSGSRDLRSRALLLGAIALTLTLVTGTSYLRHQRSEKNRVKGERVDSPAEDT